MNDVDKRYLSASSTDESISMSTLDSSQESTTSNRMHAHTVPVSPLYLPSSPPFNTISDNSSSSSGGGLFARRYSKIAERTYIRFVQQDGINILYVPPHMRTRNVYIASILSNPIVINCIHQTEEYCTLAVQQDGTMIRFVRPEWISRSMLRAALMQTGEAIVYVEQICHPTKDMYATAVQTTPHAIRHIPLKSITADMCKMAITSDPQSIVYVPQQFITRELVTYILDRAKYRVFEFLIRSNRVVMDGSLWSYALERNASLLELLPVDEQTFATVISAVYRHPDVAMPLVRNSETIVQIVLYFLGKRVCRNFIFSLTTNLDKT